MASRSSYTRELRRRTSCSRPSSRKISSVRWTARGRRMGRRARSPLDDDGVDSVFGEKQCGCCPDWSGADDHDPRCDHAGVYLRPAAVFRVDGA